MKRSFIRGIFGVKDDDRRFHKCRNQIDKDIEYCLHNAYDLPFVAYVFGEDNYKQLIDMGVNAVLVDKRPIVWDLDSQMMRHKLEFFKAGMEEFDEVIFLDWDVLPIKKIPDNIWDSLGSKAPLQAILRRYKRNKATWRDADKNIIPCAAFVYIREKSIANGMIDTWRDMGRPWSEEIVLAKYTDDMDGGWKGMDYYWNRFEADYFVLEQRLTLAYPQEYRDQKDKCYHHFHRLGVSKGMDRIENRTEPLMEWERLRRVNK
jgi:hypothetical protein